MNDLVWVFLTAFLQFLSVGFPLAILAYINKSSKPLIGATFFLIAFSFNSIFSFLISTKIPASFNLNWEVEIFEFLWPISFIYACKCLTSKEAGFRFPKYRTAFLWSAAIGVLFAIFNIAEMITFNDLPSFEHPISKMLFQFTMPGLGEEVIYRGILLAILNHYLGKQWTIFRIQFGMGVILVSILFVLVHLLSYSLNQNAILWNWDLINFKILPQIILFSFVLGFIREKTNSVWPCVVCHNLMNGLSYTGIWAWSKYSF